MKYEISLTYAIFFRLLLLKSISHKKYYWFQSYKSIVVVLSFFPKRYADIFDLIICILSFIKLIDDFFFDKTNHEVCFSLCRAFQQARFVVMNYYQNPFSFGIASCQSKQPTFYISISQKLTNIQLLVQTDILIKLLQQSCYSMPLIDCLWNYQFHGNLSETMIIITGTCIRVRMIQHFKNQFLVTGKNRSCK